MYRSIAGLRPPGLVLEICVNQGGFNPVHGAFIRDFLALMTPMRGRDIQRLSDMESYLCDEKYVVFPINRLKSHFNRDLSYSQ